MHANEKQYTFFMHSAEPEARVAWKAWFSCINATTLLYHINIFMCTSVLLKVFVYSIPKISIQLGKYRRGGQLTFLSLVTILQLAVQEYLSYETPRYFFTMYVPTIRRGALEAGAVVGAPRGHHRDVLRVKGRGRCEGGVRMSRVRVSRVRMTRTSVRTHRRRGAARVAGERVMRRVRLHPVLPGRRLLPSGRIYRSINHRSCIP